MEVFVSSKVKSLLLWDYPGNVYFLGACLPFIKYFLSQNGYFFSITTRVMLNRSNIGSFLYQSHSLQRGSKCDGLRVTCDFLDVEGNFRRKCRRDDYVKIGNDGDVKSTK